VLKRTRLLDYNRKGIALGNVPFSENPVLHPNRMTMDPNLGMIEIEF
jgi:hypothetical protein